METKIGAIIIEYIYSLLIIFIFSENMLQEYFTFPHTNIQQSPKYPAN